MKPYINKRYIATDHPTEFEIKDISKHPRDEMKRNQSIDDVIDELNDHVPASHRHMLGDATDISRKVQKIMDCKICSID